jgi:hypothetical protein
VLLVVKGRMELLIHLKFEIRYAGRELSVAHSKITVAPVIFGLSVVATHTLSIIREFYCFM